MDVITMEKLTWLLPKLRAKAANIPHLQHLTIISGEVFCWNHNACAITYDASAEYAEAQLLHEFGHALLNHKQYLRDIELLTMERGAWDRATTLAREFNIHICEDYIEETLDTYRDWLHTRSLCPHCTATGIQTERYHYQCLACLHTWRVNDARTCQLRRYRVTKNTP